MTEQNGIVAKFAAPPPQATPDGADQKPTSSGDNGNPQPATARRRRTGCASSW
jgi:hypothetical protein